MHADDCPLCGDAAAPVLWRDDSCRVVSAADADYPAFLRVIWQAHVREMTDLDSASQQHLLRVVLAVERVLRAELAPDKINLATLGNQVPHLHWHVIPRFADDAHFPDPVWAARRRAGVAHGVDERRMVEALRKALGKSSAG
jgi:diadenosine tetraphosphate (Ap4A) HIT family hydrolase